MRWLLSLALFKWLGGIVMRRFMGGSQPTSFDPGSWFPSDGQPPPWAPQGQYPPPPQPYPYPPQHQHPSGQHDEETGYPVEVTGESGEPQVAGESQTTPFEGGSPTPPLGDDGPPQSAPTSAETQPPPPPPQPYPPPGQVQAPPPGYGQQPYYYPQPVYQQQPSPRRRRRKGCLITMLALAALLVVGVIVGLPFARDAYESIKDRVMTAIGLESEDATGSFPVDDEDLPTEEVGVQVQDNHLSFTVNGFDCGVNVSGQTPDGQFCLVRVGVENTGSDPRHFVMSSQWLIDANGNRYPGVVWVSNTQLPDLVLPGQSLDGQIAFDVPEDASIVYVQLHESPFSPGVLVDLR